MASNPQSGARENQHPNTVNFASAFLRGVGQVYDIQLSAARKLLHTQARAAAAFGLPDYSSLFDDTESSTRQVLAASAEQIIDTAQRTNETIAELQRQAGRVVEKQTAVAAETWQRGLEQLGAQTEQALSELRETARQTADEAVQTTESIGEATRETLREGAAQWREGAQDALRRGREGVAQGAEATRQGAHAAADDAKRTKAA
jgi:DNA anti-recombination protein RmuC